jgi:hypothetical protein
MKTKKPEWKPYFPKGPRWKKTKRVEQGKGAFSGLFGGSSRRRRKRHATYKHDPNAPSWWANLGKGGNWPSGMSPTIPATPWEKGTELFTSESHAPDWKA